MSAAVGTGVHAISAGSSMCDGSNLNARWFGRNLTQTPEATPQAWTTALFDALEVVLEAFDSWDEGANTDTGGAFYNVGELYVMALGTSVTRPAATQCSFPRSRVMMNTNIRL